MEHRRSGDAPHEGLLKVERREFRCVGLFRCLGFRFQGSGFWVLGSGFWVQGLGFGVWVFRHTQTHRHNTPRGSGLSKPGLSGTGPSRTEWDWPE